MRQPHGLGQVRIIQLERWRHRCVQNLDLEREHFDLARHEIRIGRSFGTQAHAAAHCNAELVAQPFGDGKRRRAIRIADDLHETLAVAQIDEDHAAVIAAPMDPAAKRDRLVEIAPVDAAAIIRAFQVGLRRVSFVGARCGRHRRAADVMDRPAAARVRSISGIGDRRVRRIGMRRARPY